MNAKSDIPETNRIPLRPGMIVKSKWPVYIDQGGEMGCVERAGDPGSTIWLPQPLMVIAVFEVNFKPGHGSELNVLCLAGNGNVGWIHSGWVTPDVGE